MRLAFMCAAVVVATLVGSCGDAADNEPRAFVKLGSGLLDLAPFWLDEADELRSATRAITNGASAHSPEEGWAGTAVAGLETPAADGTSGAAFILSGCAETGARLTIDGSDIDAELTGGDGAGCAEPNYFLAVFDIPEEDIPQDAQL